MIDHATDVIPMLFWMIVVIGGALVSLLIWIAQRIQIKVDEIPAQVAKKVDAIHAELLEKVDRIRGDQHDMARDLRAELTGLDRRVLRIEIQCGAQHQRPIDPS